MTDKPVIGTMEDIRTVTVEIITVTLTWSEDDLVRAFVLDVDGHRLAGEFRRNQNGQERPLFPDEFEQLFGTSECDCLVGTRFEVRSSTRNPDILRIPLAGTPIRFYGQKHLSGAKLAEDRLQFAQKVASESCRLAIDIINDARDRLGEMIDPIKARGAQVYRADALVSDFDAPVAGESATAEDSL